MPDSCADTTEAALLSTAALRASSDDESVSDVMLMATRFSLACCGVMLVARMFRPWMLSSTVAHRAVSTPDMEASKGLAAVASTLRERRARTLARRSEFESTAGSPS